MKKNIIISAAKFVASSAISAAAGVATASIVNSGLNNAVQKNCAVEQKGFFGRKYFTNVSGEKISKKNATDMIILNGDDGLMFVVNGTGMVSGSLGVGAALGTSKAVDFSIMVVEKKIKAKKSTDTNITTESDDEDVENEVQNTETETSNDEVEVQTEIPVIKEDIEG